MDATRCNTSSPSAFSVVEMVSPLQLYATIGLNLLKKVMNTKGCRISFHNSTESRAVMVLAIDNEKRSKPEC